MKNEKIESNVVDEEYLRSLMAGSTARRDPRLQSNITSNSNSPEELENEPNKKQQVNEYSEQFLVSRQKVERQDVYIDRQLHAKASAIVHLARSREMTIGQYLDNIIADHFARHHDEIKRIVGKALNEKIGKI